MTTIIICKLPLQLGILLRACESFGSLHLFLSRRCGICSEGSWRERRIIEPRTQHLVGWWPWKLGSFWPMVMVADPLATKVPPPEQGKGVGVRGSPNLRKWGWIKTCHTSHNILFFGSWTFIHLWKPEPPPRVLTNSPPAPNGLRCLSSATPLRTAVGCMRRVVPGQCRRNRFTGLTVGFPWFSSESRQGMPRLKAWFFVGHFWRSYWDMRLADLEARLEAANPDDVRSGDKQWKAAEMTTVRQTRALALQRCSPSYHSVFTQKRIGWSDLNGSIETWLHRHMWIGAPMHRYIHICWLEWIRSGSQADRQVGRQGAHKWVGT